MKKLLKRLRNLWELSKFDIISISDDKVVIGKNIVTNELEILPPKQAQIIKMNNPVKGFLQENDI
jgi:hypothetical protein